METSLPGSQQKQMQEEQRVLVGRLVEAAKTDGRELVGRDGMPAGLVELVLETALQAEMDAHLGRGHGETFVHLAEVYGADVSKATITAITDRVLEGMTE
ncbi:hypothetical protein ABGB12_05385 [Actinocorallia sp. B10E7]|uniref:hypothetical protein n=1 Tax=Actinocorallia sp. B10E7 TaxID=3153558 RepID=UPI00325DA830